MIYRVTESMKYVTLTNSLSSVQVQSANLMEKMSTQKNINRLSDDPVGVGKVLNYSSTMSSIEQYQTNITNIETWLSLTDTTLSSIRDLISEAQEIAVSQSGAVASDETMDSSADVLSGLIDSAIALMNTKQGDSYIFGGSRTDVAPFSSNSIATTIGTATGAVTNVFDGTVTSGGTYTGAENKTYDVRIVDGGSLYAANYQLSTDGGKTWGTQQNLPPKVVEGNKVNTAGGSAITAATVWNTIDGAGVASSDTITITGKTHDGTAVSGTYTITSASTGTVQDLLDKIETTFGDSVTATIDTSGKITVTDNMSGDSQMEMTLVANNESGGALDFGAIATTTSTAITLSDGITMTFSDTGSNDLAANDLFSVDASIASSYGSASVATSNTFNGTVASGGTYTGTENKTYAVKIINGGTLAAATYQISADGGQTWGTTQTNLSAPVTLGDGITMIFTAGTQNLTTNDLFTVNAYTAGYYQGNDASLTVQISKNNNFVYNITGSSAFTVANGPVATAAIVNSGALAVEDTITLTRGDTAGSWTITDHDQYPNMVITSMSDTTVTIDADNNGTNDITLNLSGEWRKGNTASFTIVEGGTPSTPTLSSVEVEGPGSVDLLGTLNTLKSALESHDVNAVAAQIDDLENIQTQVLQKQTEAGSKSSSIELTSSSLTALNEQITSMKSKIEDADLDKLIISYQMKQIALEASYNLASQIGRMTILDYLR